MKPATHSPQVRTPLWRELREPLAVAAASRRSRVLVVEDDPVQALLLTLMLEHLGVVYTLVTDGAQAIEAVKTASYSLVLMDYLMPVVNGVEATRGIRRWERDIGRPRTPIAAVTASAMPNECQRYIEAGMDDFIPKPFTTQGIAALLARHGASPAGVRAPLFSRHGATL